MKITTKDQAEQQKENLLIVADSMRHALEKALEKMDAISRSQIEAVEKLQSVQPGMSLEELEAYLKASLASVRNCRRLQAEGLGLAGRGRHLVREYSNALNALLNSDFAGMVDADLWSKINARCPEELVKKFTSAVGS